MTKELRSYLRSSFFANILWAFVLTIIIVVAQGLLDSFVTGRFLLYRFLGRFLDCFAVLYTFDIAKCGCKRIIKPTLSEHVSKAIPSALIRATIAVIVLFGAHLLAVSYWGSESFVDFFGVKPHEGLVIRMVLYFLFSIVFAFLGELFQFWLFKKVIHSKKVSMSHEQ